MKQLKIWVIVYTVDVGIETYRQLHMLVKQKRKNMKVHHDKTRTEANYASW